jgi:hypothetical protein
MRHRPLAPPAALDLRPVSDLIDIRLSGGLDGLMNQSHRFNASEPTASLVPVIAGSISSNAA